MTNDAQSQTPSPEELQRLKRLLSDRAVKLAVANKWEEAVQVNTEYVRLFPRDSDGYNRLGKSLAEVDRIADAREAYNQALEIEPTNTIAERNLERLTSLESRGGQGSRGAVDSRLFVEETGKAAVALLQAVDRDVVDSLDAGDLLELELKGNAVNVLSPEGTYVGMVEPKLGLRMSRLMNAGNRYAAALLATTGDIRVIVREVFQHPSQAETVSFPQSKLSDFRPYMRTSVLRRIDRLADMESDDGDDHDDDDDDGESWDEDATGIRIVATDDDDEENFD